MVTRYVHSQRRAGSVLSLKHILTSVNSAVDRVRAGFSGRQPLKLSPRSPLAAPFLGLSRLWVSYPNPAPGDNAGVRPGAI